MSGWLAVGGLIFLLWYFLKAIWKDSKHGPWVDEEWEERKDEWDDE